MPDRAIHRNDLSAMPTVGAGSSQREDFPAQQNMSTAGWPARRFLPLAGACGRRGFWAWASARDSRYDRVLAGAQGVTCRGQKPQGRRQGRAFFPPFLWRSKERGRGVAGARSPRGLAWGSPHSVLRLWAEHEESSAFSLSRPFPS